MNKRGQEGLTIATGEYVFLVVLITILGYLLINGIEEQELNELKANEISAAISSVYMLEGDINLFLDLGDDYNAEIENGRIRIYKNTKTKTAVSDIFYNKKFEFASQVKDKTHIINIRKEANRVIVS